MASDAPAVGKDLTQAAENIAPAFHNAPRQGELPALNYVNQPPMVPHSVANYQVTKKCEPMFKLPQSRKFSFEWCNSNQPNSLYGS